MNEIYDKWMREALKEAKCALLEEEIPIGAVVVFNNKIIGRGHNQVELLQDPTAHARTKKGRTEDLPHDENFVQNSEFNQPFVL